MPLFIGQWNEICKNMPFSISLWTKRILHPRNFSKGPVPAYLFLSVRPGSEPLPRTRNVYNFMHQLSHDFSGEEFQAVDPYVPHTLHQIPTWSPLLKNILNRQEVISKEQIEKHGWFSTQLPSSDSRRAHVLVLDRDDHAAWSVRQHVVQWRHFRRQEKPDIRQNVVFDQSTPTPAVKSSSRWEVTLRNFASQLNNAHMNTCRSAIYIIVSWPRGFGPTPSLKFLSSYTQPIGSTRIDYIVGLRETEDCFLQMRRLLRVESLFSVH